MSPRRWSYSRSGVLSPTRRATFVLALSFAASGILAFLATLVLPLLPDDPPVLDFPVETGLWLYIFWHLAAGAGALAYVFARRTGGAVSPSRRFVLIALAVAGAVVSGGAVLSFADVAHLPQLTDGVTFTGLIATGVGPATAALLAVAAVCAFAIRDPNKIDRALALSLVALALDTTLLCIGGRPYTSSFYAGRLLLLLGALFVLVSAVRSLVASRIQLGVVQSTLDHVESESAGRAGRIRALWQMASDSRPAEAELFSATLRTAASALRPGRRMDGHLSHIVGGAVVIDATSRPASGNGDAANAIYPGASFPIERTMASLLLESDTVRAWNDLAFLRGRGMLAEQLGLGSLIGAPIAIGGRTYFLTFVCTDAMTDEPFAEDDIAYVDVVASFFISRFRSGRSPKNQVSGHPRNATGLENRLRFRQAIRDEIRAGKAFTMGLLDLDGSVTSTNVKGLKSATKSSSRSPPISRPSHQDDLVARMSGDEFGIVLRNRGSARPPRQVSERVCRPVFGPSAAGERKGSAPPWCRRVRSRRAARFPADAASGAGTDAPRQGCTRSCEDTRRLDDDDLRPPDGTHSRKRAPADRRVDRSDRKG